jgi:hypothetical protein
MQERPRIILYRERDFGEKFNATFAFLSQEFKNFISVQFRLLGVPLLIVMLLSGLNTAFTLESMGNLETEIGPMVFVLYILSWMLFSMAILAVAGYVKVYNSLNSPEEKVTSAAVWKIIRGKVIPGMFLTLIYGLVIGIGILFLIIPGVYLAIAMALAHVVYVFEDKDIFSSIGKSITLVNQKWFSSLGFLFILSLICGIAASILQMPSMILGAIAGVSFASGTNGFSIPIWATMLVVAIPGMIAYLAYMINFLGDVFLYGSLREMYESPGVMSAIDEFGKRESPIDEKVVRY